MYFPMPVQGPGGLKESPFPEAGIWTQVKVQRGENRAAPPGSLDSVLDTWCRALTCWYQERPFVYVAQFTSDPRRLLNSVIGKKTLQDGEKNIYDGSPWLETNQGNNKPNCVQMYLYKLIMIESMCMEANLSSLIQFLKTL